MKVLITGFQPFGGETINPSFEVVRALRCDITKAELIKLELPTVFGKSIEMVTAAIAKEKPDFVLSIGQAGGKSSICVERVAINIDDARIADNENQQPIDIPINSLGPAAYFATIPIKAIVAAMKERNIPAAISDSAGTYVCNHVMYGVLDYISKNDLNIKAGFIHIPYLPEQTLDKPNMSSMSKETTLEAIHTAIKVLVEQGGASCTTA